jgi:hypothetical protein
MITFKYASHSLITLSDSIATRSLARPGRNSIIFASLIVRLLGLGFEARVHGRGRAVHLDPTCLLLRGIGKRDLQHFDCQEKDTEAYSELVNAPLSRPLHQSPHK